VTETIGLLEGMATTRSIRRFHPDPIPDHLLRSVLKAATWAPSGGNMQNCRLLIDEFYPREGLASETDPSRKRLMGGGMYLADHMGTEPPVLVLFCRDPAAHYNSQPGIQNWVRGSSVYPAVQNLLLAARASGLGGCLTTLHLRYHAEIKALLGIPDSVDVYALIPLGYPRDKFGPLRRRPVEEVSYLDAWGTNLPDA
jgi:nitroreductase